MDAKDLQIEQLKAQLSAVTEQFKQQLQEKDSLIASLQSQVKRLLITVRGSRQERINPDQLLLFSEAEIQQLADELEQAKQNPDRADDEPNGDISDDQPGTDATTSDDVTDDGEASDGKGAGNKANPKRNHKGRRRLPASITREIVRHELSEEDRKCPCCSELRTEFSVEKSEQLEYVPPHWKAIEHHRIKYCCTACQENVIVAPSHRSQSRKACLVQACVLTQFYRSSAITCRCIAKKIFTAVLVISFDAVRSAIGFHSWDCWLSHW